MNSGCHAGDIRGCESGRVVSRSAVFQGPDRGFLIEDVAVPRLGPRDVLVAVTCATICSSDLHTVSGRRLTPLPLVLGHEMTGRVTAAGADSPWSLGARVVWSILRPCGLCFFCERRMPAACERLMKFGHDSRPLSGGFATHCLLPDGTDVFAVPARLPDELAAVAVCAGATAAAVVREAALQPGETVVIQGAGMVGAIACLMAQAAGATVVVEDPDPARARRTRQEFGAVPASAIPARGADAAFELSGSPEAASRALDGLRKGGRLLLAGAVFPADPPRWRAEQIVKRALRIQGVYNYLPPDLESALAFLAGPAGSRLAACIDGRYGLGQLDQALERAASDKGPLRIAVYPGLPGAPA